MQVENLLIANGLWRFVSITMIANDYWCPLLKAPRRKLAGIELGVRWA